MLTLIIIDLILATLLVILVLLQGSDNEGLGLGGGGGGIHRATNASGRPKADILFLGEIEKRLKRRKVVLEEEPG